MKKNTMMRVASIMLVLVLLTSSVISGTFAKYVTSDDGQDTARVAKFGVTVQVDGPSGFGKEYQTHDTSKYSGAVSVKSVDDVNVVAPGTDSDDVDGHVKFTITGKPEVATKLDITMTVNSDIYLGEGTYGNPTTAATDDEFIVEKDYYPVVFTLTSDKEATPIAVGNLDTIAAAFNDRTRTYDPNEVVTETYELTWVWAFQGEQTLNGTTYDADTVDAADTMLGNLAAQKGWNYTEVSEYSTVIDYEVVISVTQID